MTESVDAALPRAPAGEGATARVDEAVTRPERTAAPDVRAADESPPDTSGATARPFELLSAMTRILLDPDSLREPVALRRAARLLASEFADWVVIDVLREDAMQRAAVAGPECEDSAPGTRLLARATPGKSSLCRDVLRSGLVLQAAADDREALGTTPDGSAILGVLRPSSLLCVPLRNDDETLGTLTLLRREGRQGFGSADLDVAEQIGANLALALRAERRYQRRADVAEVLQASLLPRKLPAIAGLDVATRYRAATEGTEVGGDFYDAFDCGQGWCFVLGDVCGKGEDAAAATAIARHGVRVLSVWDDDPAEMLRWVNHAMLARGESSRFVTIVAAQVTWEGDGGGRRLRVRLGSAGHPRAMILRADGSVQIANGGGMPLGLFEEAQLHTEEFRLAPGELLVLYSDGVTDARAEGGSVWGEEGLVGTLARCHGQPAAAVLQTVENAVFARANRMATDDVALLALRVEERASLGEL